MEGGKLLTCCFPANPLVLARVANITSRSEAVIDGTVIARYPRAR
jgi:hypothetical protein